MLNHLDFLHLDTLLDRARRQILQVYSLVPVYVLQKCYSLLVYHIPSNQQSQTVSLKKFNRR